MRIKVLAITSLVSGCLGLQANAAVIFTENFESYADTAAMQATWTGSAIGVLSTSGGFAGSKAMSHAGGTDNLLALGLVAPSATENVVLTAKIFDDALNSNKRMSIGFRNSTASSNVFEMGMYNQVEAKHYATRAAVFAGGATVPGGAASGWTAIGSNNNAPVSGWHTFTATFSLNSIVVTLDQGSDGSINSTTTITLTGVAYANSGFNQIRLGGPSNATSGGGGVFYDDISVATVAVPEPASLALLSLGGLLVAGRRRQSA